MATYIAESEPLSDFKTLLEDNWVDYIDVPKPNVVIANDPEETVARVNLQDGDYVIISYSSSEQIRPRGNFTYEDHIVSILFTFLTKKDRQRMRDIYREIRGICSIKKHDFPNWQLIRPMNHRELINTDLNIWRGEFIAQIENHAVLMVASL